MPPSTGQIARLAGRLLLAFVLSIFLFATLYWFIGKSHEKIFSTITGDPSFEDCLYFSVATVTTLGYGDLSPVGWARLVACIEVILGLGFVGYSVSQIVSAKQEALIEYLANDRVAQTYNECLTNVADAKESIADRRRSMQRRVPVDDIEFVYNRSNPFYSSLRAVQILNGYTAHIEAFGQVRDFSERVERAAHHVEELASFTRKYVNLLVTARASWCTPRTIQILSQLCDAIDEFALRHIAHTRYAVSPYKGGGMYLDIVTRTTSDIRKKLGRQLD